MVKNVPVILQMEAQECGAACLAMIAAYYGKWIPLDQVRSDCGISRDGSTAKSIVQTAREYGLTAQGYRMEPERLKTCKFPMILHWGFNHFVVLNGFRGNKAVINDPARGRITVEMKELDECFTGIALEMEPGKDFRREGEPPGVFRFIKKRLSGSGKILAFVLLWSVVNMALTVTIPFFTKIFMDQILTGNNMEWLKLLICVMLGVLVFRFVATAIQDHVWTRIEGRMAVQASSAFMWHVLRLPVRFFAQRYIGDIVARQESNESIASTLIRQIAPAVVNVCLIVVYLFIMLRYSVMLSLVGLAAVAVNLVMMRLVSAKRANNRRALERKIGLVSGTMTAGFDMIESIKAAGAENGFYGRWSGQYASANTDVIQYRRRNQYYSSVPQFIQQMANAAVLMLGVYLIIDGQFTIGMLLAFQGFLSSFLTPVENLSQLGSALVEMRTQMERVDDVFCYPADIAGEMEDMTDEKLDGCLELSHITFGYNQRAIPLIEDFSLRLEKGKSVAFVGGSGSGKSTLAKLVLGLYPLWSGEILFDGKPRREWPHIVMTNSVSAVDQEIVLFEDTVADNITMWDSGIPEQDIVEACRLAEIHEDIMQWPDGYAHIIRENGKNLSGGQRQRIEIARALVTKPSILILDEATSALDAGTERRIMENLKARGITLIIVAHRLSTIRDCDEIIVLREGTACERGTHEELIKKHGQYEQMINR